MQRRLCSDPFGKTAFGIATRTRLRIMMTRLEEEQKMSNEAHQEEKKTNDERQKKKMNWKLFVRTYKLYICETDERRHRLRVKSTTADERSRPPRLPFFVGTGGGSGIQRCVGGWMLHRLSPYMRCCTTYGAKREVLFLITATVVCACVCWVL